METGLERGSKQKGVGVWFGDPRGSFWFRWTRLYPIRLYIHVEAPPVSLSRCSALLLPCVTCPSFLLWPGHLRDSDVASIARQPLGGAPPGLLHSLNGLVSASGPFRVSTELIRKF